MTLEIDPPDMSKIRDPDLGPREPLSKRARCELLRDRALERLQAGHREEALTLLGSCENLARECGDDFLLHLIRCNIAATEIELGRNRDEHLRTLRQMLVDNRELELCRLAAYQVARIYDLESQFKKALFYARIAQERAKKTKRREWIAASGNQMGSLLLAESRFDEARQELKAALELTSGADEVLRALILDNLGYCHLVQDRPADGFACLFEGLRMIRRLGANLWEGQFHLTLCYGYLDIGRWRCAARHGLRALHQSEQVGNAESTKNALFLLGETASLAGNPEEAYQYFAQLQSRFYPDQTFLPDFLLAVDVRGLINLKA